MCFAPAYHPPPTPVIVMQSRHLGIGYHHLDSKFSQGLLRLNFMHFKLN